MDKSKGIVTLNDNSFLFLEFMRSNGFKPENCDNILELVQAVPGSLSQYLKTYKQFLLSRAVKYSDLKTYDIKGAYGYVEESEGIVVPKTIIADEYFREKQGKVVDKQIPRYTHTNINEFDTVIAFSDDILNKEDLRQILTGLSFGFINRCFGFIAAKDDRMLLEKQDVFKYVLDELNKASNKQYTLVHDTDSCKNKELYLIKNK